MDKIFSIGFARKSAKEFFYTLLNNGVDQVIDVRMEVPTKLKSLRKNEGLKFFLKKMGNIYYVHEEIFVPTQEMLDEYAAERMDKETFDKYYRELMLERNAAAYIEDIGIQYWVNSCILGDEPSVENCYRGLVIDEVIKVFPEIEACHLL